MREMMHGGYAASSASTSSSPSSSSSYPSVFRNGPLIAAIVAFVIAQTIKFLVTWYKERRWDTKQLIGSGGMPSSHSATVTALAVAIGIQDGLNSPTFATATILASVTICTVSRVYNKIILTYISHKSELSNPSGSVDKKFPFYLMPREKVAFDKTETTSLPQQILPLPFSLRCSISILVFVYNNLHTMAFSWHLPNTNTAEICFHQHDWEKTVATTNDCSISYFFEENPTISMSTFIGREQKESHFDTMQERASYNEKSSLLITKSQEQGKERKNKKSGKRSNEAKPPTTEAFVSVRARRGQATNSHSLAERVRRERISERMKLLQSLIPGCDQVTGKALVLDAIINYVKSLQNQVEFLSMTLASVDTMFGDCGMAFDGTMNQIEQFNVEEEAMENEEHGANNYLMIDPFSLNGQGPTSLSQDGSIPSVQGLILEQEQRIVNHIDLTNMYCYFQY